MEFPKRANRLIVLAVSALLSATAGIVAYRQVTKSPFGQMLRKDLPMLNVTLVFRDDKNQNLDPAATQFGGVAPEPPAEQEHCAPLIGGDTSAVTVLDNWNKRPDDCPKEATWYVKKHPIALTVYFNDGDRMLKWWENDAQLAALRQSRFLQGLFFGLLKSMKIKAEQLNLQGLQGEFLGRLLQDAIAADAELHYDMAHADHGWVLSYARADSWFADQALPAMAGLLAENGYRIGKLPEAVVETHIGMEHLFLTEYRDRIYLAQSLEALMNVLENQKSGEARAKAPFNITLRGEAFLDKLLPVLTGNAERNHIELNFDPDAAEAASIALPGGPWLKPLHERIFAGVLASIPHDAFAAFAAAFYIPPTTSVADWRNLTSDSLAKIQPGSEEGGVAVIWDYAENDATGAIGIAVANQVSPQSSAEYGQYFKDTDLTDECAGGSVFLAASSQELLTRMKEACAHQSLSPLDWQRGQEKSRYLASPLVAFVNPGAGLRALFLAGGAGNSDDQEEFAPKWRQDYEKAKAAMRQDGDTLFHSLPIFSYAGKASGDSADLQGVTVKQGAVQ